MMKTLQQVEPRTDVATLAGDATAVFVITSPGSYYLSGNVPVPASRSGIAIAAANVVLATRTRGSVRAAESVDALNNA